MRGNSGGAPHGDEASKTRAQISALRFGEEEETSKLEVLRRRRIRKRGNERKHSRRVSISLLRASRFCGIPQLEPKFNTIVFW